MTLGGRERKSKLVEELEIGVRSREESEEPIRAVTGSLA